MMIQQGSTLTPEDISAAFESMSRAVVALLNQGFRVVTPVPETYHDVASGTSNATLTPNSVGRVTGRNLKLDPADPQQGVFFIGADGAERRAITTCGFALWFRAARTRFVATSWSLP